MSEYPIEISDKSIHLATAQRKSPLPRSKERQRRDQLTTIRKNDTILGRAAAYKALRSLGFAEPPVVPRGERGMPVWPTGVVGSITHCDNFSVAAVANTADLSCLGIDFQKYRDFRNPLSKRICTPQEQVWCACGEEESERRALWIFSAKESVFKALYPSVRTYFGFHAVEFSPTEVPNSFRAVLQSNLSPQFRAGFTFQAGYQVFSDAVFTWAFIPA